MPGIFDTAVLQKVVENLDGNPSFLLDLAFSRSETSQDEKIYFDTDDSLPRITPFCSPHVAGQVVDQKGFSTNSFEPAYCKDKRVFKPKDTIKRVKGEALTGSLSQSKRLNMNIKAQLLDQKQMLTRRQEVMAAEALRTGAIVVSGEKYETTTVDFQRDASLTVTLPGGSMWGEAGVKPATNIEAWAQSVQDVSGAVATTVVMDTKSWRLYADSLEFRERAELRRGSSSTMNVDPKVFGAQRNARFMGSDGDFDFWVYNSHYVDEAGATQKFIPDNGVLLLSPTEVAGVRHYASIQDIDHDFTGAEMASKSWVEKDPSVRWLLMQSAPLTVPYRTNATFAATVA